MKILLINYRYFVSGGPERYMFNVKEALEEEGHELIPFSIEYPNNVSSEYSKYFVAPLDASGSVYYEEHKFNLKTYYKTIERLFYSKDVERALIKLIEDTQPDVAYVLHYLRKLSPAVLAALKKKNIPMVVRLSDYQMVCPQTHCLRDNKACDICVGGSLYPSVKYKCVKGSGVASVLNLVSTKFHVMKGYFNYIDDFVLTNDFARNMMIKDGYQESRLNVIPTFVVEDGGAVVRSEEGDYVTYVGRLDPTKGVDVAIKSFHKLHEDDRNLKLLIIGEGQDEYVESLHRLAQQGDACDQIKFLGHMDKKEINSYLKYALLNVVTSRWYENLPNVILESYSFGTPVIASDIGSLPGSVITGVSGELFHVGDHEDLAEKIKGLLKDRTKLERMSVNCIELVRKQYSKSVHIDKLTSLFKATISRNV